MNEQQCFSFGFGGREGRQREKSAESHRGRRKRERGEREGERKMDAAAAGAGITTHNGISEISPCSLAAPAPAPAPAPALALALAGTHASSPFLFPLLPPPPFSAPRRADILLYKRDCTFSIVSAAVPPHGYGLARSLCVGFYRQAIVEFRCQK